MGKYKVGLKVLFFVFFCKAQAMIAERKILLCKLPSSGESETIEIKPCSTIVYILGVSGKRFRQLIFSLYADTVSLKAYCSPASQYD